MILGFKTLIKNKYTNFVPKIKAGLIQNPTPEGIKIHGNPKEPLTNVKPKIHTIRKDFRNRWKLGIIIHFATGVRTKSYQCFAESKCISTQIFEITFLPNHTVCNTPYLPYLGCLMFVDGFEMSIKTMEEIAINDGFDSLQDFLIYFRDSGEKQGNEIVFEGKIIHWTDKRY